MAIPTDGGALENQPVVSLLIQTLITAFTFLTAFSIRDSITQSISALTPNDASKKLYFTFFVALFFLFVTVSMAYSWQSHLPK